MSVYRGVHVCVSVCVHVCAHALTVAWGSLSLSMILLKVIPQGYAITESLGDSSDGLKGLQRHDFQYKSWMLKDVGT